MINHNKRFSKISTPGCKIHVYDRVEHNCLCDKNNSNYYGLRVRTYTKNEMLKELQKPYGYCGKCIKLLKTRKYKKVKVEKIERKKKDTRTVSERVEARCVEAKLYLKENNIDYTLYLDEEGFNEAGALKIDRFVYYPMSKRWTSDGNSEYYWSKGIEDFIERFCKWLKKEKS